MKQRVAIIGAGVGGLATANLLAASGYEVDVYEAHDMPGGRASVLHQDGFRFDTGPSWFLMPDVYKHYFQILGKNMSDYLQLERLDPAYKVFFEHDSPLSVQSDLTNNTSMFESIEPGAGKALERYLKDSKLTYDLAMDNFLYDNLSFKNVFSMRNLRLLPKLIPALTIPMDRYISTFVRDRRLKQILEYPTVFLGSSPFSTPSLYRLMSHLDFNQGVYFPKGGMYEIVKALTTIGDELGVSYHYNSPITKILTTDGAVTGLEIDSKHTIPADIVISNADLHFTETTLLPKNLQTYPESYWRTKQASPSAILLYLGVKGKLDQLEHHNLFFIDDWKANFDAIYSDKKWPEKASMYVSKTTATDATTAPKNYENIFVLVPGPSGDLEGKDAQRLVDGYIAQLSTMSNIKDLKERIITKKVYLPKDFGNDFHAWQNTSLGLSHILRQSAFMRPQNISHKVKNLYYVGANTAPGIGLPMCLISAELVYKRITNEPTKGKLKAVSS